MVMKMNYQTKEIIWVATPASGRTVAGDIYAIQKDVVDKIVLPEEGDSGFEWFYSQHHIVPLPDIDNNPNTDDFTVFDNGQERGVYGLYEGLTNKNDFYSRIVHYRVDNETRTIKQIFEYGKEASPSLSSYYYGSAQYISELNENMYLGCFGMLDFANGTEYGKQQGSKIVAVTDKGKQECLWYFPNEYTYRAHYLSMSDFSSISAPALGIPGRALYKSNNLWTTWSEPRDNQAVRYELSDISQQKDGKVTVTGWAYLEKNANQYKNVYLVAKNDENAYKIDLVQRDNMIPTSESVASSYRQGFYDRSVDMNELSDGKYELGLQVEAGGQVGYVALPYIITVGEPAADVGSIEKSDILAVQQNISSQLNSALGSGAYSLQKPFISIDPYGISPLTAIAVFKTAQPATITVSVESKDGADVVVNEFTTQTTDHQIPIYGLYAGEATNVTFTAHYADGTSESQTVALTGGSLPAGFAAAAVQSADPTQMVDGWTFVTSGSLYGYTYALDESGNVRWVLNSKGAGAVGAFLPLKNGHILTGGDKSEGQYYKYSLWEMDLTGRIYHEYMLDGIHHDAVEMENGNFLIAANNPDGKTKEDTIYEIDRTTGEIVHVWDLNSYFNVPNVDANGEHVADINYGSSTEDWFHNNSLDYRESDHSVIISGRHQDAVIKLNLQTGELDWILSDPNDLWTAEQQEKLLQPVGEGFEWQYGQHCAKWLPNGDIFIFDNGNFRSKTAEGVTDAAAQGYSRAVIYRVDEQKGTVEQIWQFGKEYGAELLAAYVSSVQYLGENHYLIDFGGIVKDGNGNASYNNMAGIGGSSQTQIFEVKDNQVIFHAKLEQNNLGGNSYRAQRLQPYLSPEELNLSAVGTRIGGLYRYGKATTATLDLSLPTFTVANVDIADNGAQLVTSIGLNSACSNAALYLVGSSTYSVGLTAGTTVTGTINNSELPTDKYHLYLACDGKLCDLQRVWDNTTVARAFPNSYQLTVDSSNTTYGWTEGNGVYYANTPVTLTAHVQEKGKFNGWYSGNTFLSGDSQYTLTPTADMVITAHFSSQNDASGGGGGAGGAGGGGGVAFTKPSVSVSGSGGKVEATDDGTVTITPDAGYQIEKITVNGEEVDIPADGKLTGLDANDTVVITFEKAEAGMPFADVADDAWYADAVQYVYENGMMNGTSDTIFNPNATTTRGMIVTILHRLEGEPAAVASSFTDVQRGAWYADAIAWAAANSVVNGVSETSFAPDSSITREQLVAILYRYAQCKGYDVTAVVDLQAYSDVSQISDYALTAMQWANAEQLITGSGATTLDPQGYVTRAQVATILMRFSKCVENGVA